MIEPEDDVLNFEIVIIGTEGEKPRKYYDEYLEQNIEVLDRKQLIDRLDNILPSNRKVGYTILKAWKPEDEWR